MEYREYKLKEIMYNFKYGTMPKKEKIKSFEEGKYPIYTGYLISGYYDECNIENETLIVVARGVGGTGDVKLTTKKCFLTNLSIAMFNDEKIVSNKYLYYYFKIHNLRYLDSGSAQSQITINDLKNVKVPVPKRDIQDKIVKILSQLDIKIKLNNQINDNLYNICNVIFHNYMDKYSEQIEYTKIIDIADRVVTGKTPSTKNEELWNGYIPFITIPDMHNQVFTIDTERTISKVGAKSLIPKNSISVSCIATVGLVSISTKESQTNQQINSIVLKNDYDLYYLFEFLSEQESYMKNIAGGSTTYNINKTTFENIEVPYLPQNIVQEFHNTVCKLFDKIKLNQFENKKLEQLRDTLLPKLMNGEIDLDKIKI